MSFWTIILSLVLEAIMKISQEIEAIKWRLKHDPNIDEAQLQVEINKKGQWIALINLISLPYVDLCYQQQNFSVIYHIFQVEMYIEKFLKYWL